MSSEAFEGQLDINAILDKAEQKLFNISQQSQLSQFTNVYPLLEKVLEDWGNR